MYTNSFDYMQLNKQIIQNTMLDQPLNLALTHMSKLLGYIQSKQYDGNDPIQMSGTIKRSDGHNQQHHHINKDKNRQSISNEHNYKQINWKLDGNVQTNLSSWDLHREKFQLCGISFGPEISSFVQMHLRDIAVKEKSVDIRFWGVIRGTQQDYYIIQARKQPYKSNDQVPVGAQKNGQGANYYTYYVTNNISTSKWTQLPQIQPSHIQTARQIKKLFTGILDQQIHSNPSFKGRQKHYLKAQIVRITHALQLSPKGIYKPNDQNPKIIEYEQQVKVPDFAELNSLQSWVHKNQMILNLGRCTHFVDPKFSQEQIEAKMNELVEKDPEPERLKGITQDKVPEELGLGVQNPWILKVVGNNQVFTKDDASLVYGVILLRNIYWPGWTTIGYKNGFASIYIGNGLKSTQPSLNLYQNPDLQKQGVQVDEYPEPNPKQLPKVQPVVEGEPKPEDE